MRVHLYQASVRVPSMSSVRAIAVAIAAVAVPVSLAQHGLTITPPTPLNNNASTDSGDDYDVHVVVSDTGVWLAVWTSKDDLAGTIGTDADILVARSTDHGATWSDPAPVNSAAAEDEWGDSAARPYTDGREVWVVTWVRDQLPGVSGRGTRLLVTRSTDDGLTWETPTRLSADNDPSETRNESIQLETDGNGHWVAVWESRDGSGGEFSDDWDVFTVYSSDNGATWSAAAALNANADSDVGDDLSPRIATDGQGTWIAVWDSDSLPDSWEDRSIFVSRSVDNGSTWSDQTPLSDPTTCGSYFIEWETTDVNPRITTNKHGLWIALWSWYADDGSILSSGRVREAASTDGGVTWTVNACTRGGSRPLETPVPIADGAGGWRRFWTAYHWAPEGLGPTSRSVLTESSADGANWGDVSALRSDATGRKRFSVARAATDEQGVWAAIWSEMDEPIGVLGTDWDVLISFSADNGATWPTAAPVSVSATSDSGNDVNPQVITDGRGNWLIVWTSTDAFGGTIGDDDDILMARFAIPDCNENGTADPDDVVGGASADCNENAIPDECDISSGTSADCNNNGVPDECDLADGTLNDADGDGLPDDCNPFLFDACGFLGLGSTALLLTAALASRQHRPRGRLRHPARERGGVLVIGGGAPTGHDDRGWTAGAKRLRRARRSGATPAATSQSRYDPR